jgi:hypothetical protein
MEAEMNRLINCVACTIIVAIGNATTSASLNTIGPNGINSAGLTLFNGMPLDGDGVRVGQVEDIRPGITGFDNAGNSNSSVVPTNVYIGAGGSLTMNANIGDGHATRVASVIISTDDTDSSTPANSDAPQGVADKALLHSSAYVTAGASAAAYRDALLATQFLAADVLVQTINHSWGKDRLDPNDLFDGNSQLTLGIDWIASEFDVLNIVAGNQGQPVSDNRSIPKDNFNGMTIGRSSRIGDVYRQVSSQNNYTQNATGDRTSIALIAPGDNVETASGGNSEVIASGNSFSAPHVTGTAALLHQYASERISNAPSDQWSINGNAHRHEVMKAVLMNSADKIEEGSINEINGVPIPAGGLLGMERTVVMQDGTSDWFDSDAYDDSTLGQGQFFPLDEQMGTGHLNANRALTQFRSGEQNYEDGDVPLIGWDYGTTTGEGDNNRYRFSEELLGGSFVSITIAWDRHVEFNDTDSDNRFDSDETFEEYEDDGINPPDDSVINDLDLYFLPKFSGTTGAAEAASIATVGTVDHIFFQVPSTGLWEFWVDQHDEEAALGSSQNYAVAWWAMSAAGPSLTADFTGDGMVDGDDLAQWEGDFGVNDDSDANGDGVTDGADFLAWQREFGTGVPATPASAAVPEPAACLLAVIGLPMLRRRR